MRYVCFLSMHYVIVVVSNCVCLFILIEWHRLHKKKFCVSLYLQFFFPSNFSSDFQSVSFCEDCCHFVIFLNLCIKCTPGILEKPLEKKAGRKFGPPTAKRLIYFIDDLNMPEVDVYGTVQPHTLIRQHLDYSHW